MNNYKTAIIITSIILFFTSAFFTICFLKVLEQPQYTLAPIIATTAIPTPTPTPVNEHIKILFGGDLMFDRNIRIAGEKNGYEHILKELKPTLIQYDLVVANLEGPITDKLSISKYSKTGSTNNFIFTFDPQIAPLLSSHNIKLVNLGNNHILNFSSNGAEQTTSNLDQNNISYFGYFEDHTIAHSFAIVELKGVKIGFVNYNQFAKYGLETALEGLQKTRDNVDVLILYAHWGLEYNTTANQVIVNLAHRFADNGADVIIGSHPHVVQQVEQYKDKAIYYSLGNFVFDQYFSQNTKTGLLVEMDIDVSTKTLEFKEFEIILNSNGQTILKT